MYLKSLHYCGCWATHGRSQDFIGVRSRRLCKEHKRMGARLCKEHM